MSSIAAAPDAVSQILAEAGFKENTNFLKTHCTFFSPLDDHGNPDPDFVLMINFNGDKKTLFPKLRQENPNRFLHFGDEMNLFLPLEILSAVKEVGCIAEPNCFWKYKVDIITICPYCQRIKAASRWDYCDHLLLESASNPRLQKTFKFCPDCQTVCL